MKTRRLNKFFVCVLALSIFAGIGFGFLSPRSTMLQEMEPSEFLQILNGSGSVGERVESVTLGHDPDPFWIVKFKNPPSERVVRNLESDDADEAGQKLTQNRIRIIVPTTEQSGFGCSCRVSLDHANERSPAGMSLTFQTRGTPTCEYKMVPE